MSISPCPNCGTELEFEPRFVGKQIRCSYCNEIFTAPEPKLGEPDDNSTVIAVLAGVGALHVAAFLGLALWQGFGIALFWLIAALATEVSIWKWKSILRFIETIVHSIQKSNDELDELVVAVSDVKPQDQITSPPTNRTKSPRNRQTARSGRADDELVEVIPDNSRRSETPLPRPRSRPEKPQTLGRNSWLDSISKKGSQSRPNPNNLKSGCNFLGIGTEVNFGRGVIRDPLIYVSDIAKHGEFDASLVDTTLIVARAGSLVRGSLPYWPSYYDCTPAQRSVYLDWLATGKSDPSVELGFVFIYFYGLERRVLVDQADRIVVAKEVMRLLPIYGYSNSFRRYACGLLWLSLLLASKSEVISDALLNEAIRATPRWNDELVERYLTILFNAQKPLPADAAFHVCENDGRSASSVIVRRHREEFRSLFDTRYREKYGEGITLNASKREKRVAYQPASSSLMRGYGASDHVELPRMPDVLAISSQFRVLIEIWNESIDHLKAFSRAAKNAGGEVTSEAYEALPPELRQGDHPEMDAWMQAWEEHVDEEYRPLVPVGVLAKVKGIPERERLTKAQCLKILQTADTMGLALEPDTRMTGTNYRWDEKVILFFRENDTSDTAKYMAASALLRLGATIAEADGTVDDVELQFISSHLEGQFNLSEFDSKRLECLQYLLLHSQAGDNKIGKTLAKRLSREHRLVVGEYLVGIAAADEVITNDEVKALRKAYRLLELDTKDLDDLIAKHEASKATTATQPVSSDNELRLDHNEISRILSETRAVAGILEEAMSEVDEDEDQYPVPEPAPETRDESPAVEASVNSSEVIDIDARYRPFLIAALAKDEWQEGDLRQLASSHNLMLAGAIEAINEWSTDRFGDWIIEEGDPIQIRQDLLEEIN
ncbi:hypothetical protein DTL42_07175 [Bremerella cremea]|uniref:TerB N-terminal domain-containing protein n=1 Tax=Bremerella cremea TaxID=1031537 RepID=A0A368KX11_9BACT|nr:TerB N-terminal domain-containing protein [Bremerella cremea]RCS54886.1 hypothetical protein DTL42_07175 [Bremerella cremea]